MNTKDTNKCPRPPIYIKSKLFKLQKYLPQVSLKQQVIARQLVYCKHVCCVIYTVTEPPWRPLRPEQCPFGLPFSPAHQCAWHIGIQSNCMEGMNKGGSSRSRRLGWPPGGLWKEEATAQIFQNNHMSRRQEALTIPRSKLWDPLGESSEYADRTRP